MNYKEFKRAVKIKKLLNKPFGDDISKLCNIFLEIENNAVFSITKSIVLSSERIDCYYNGDVIFFFYLKNGILDSDIGISINLYFKQIIREIDHENSEKFLQEYVFNFLNIDSNLKINLELLNNDL